VGLLKKKMKRKCISTSLIRANKELIYTLPYAKHYELTFFKSEDIEIIQRFLNERNSTFGIHAPFIFRYKEIHPNPTSLNDELRDDTFKKNIECAHLAKNMGAQYIVIHYPNAMQKEDWRAEKKVVDSSTKHLTELREIIDIRIENVYFNDSFHSAEDFSWLLKESNATLCLDIGHLLLDSEQYEFDVVKFIDTLEEYISEVHIYYADIETYQKCHHAPWGDSKEFLRLLDRIRYLDCDFTIEASNDCKSGLEKLFEYWEGL